MYRLTKNTVIGFVPAVTWIVVGILRIYEGEKVVNIYYAFFAAVVFAGLGIYYLLIDLGKIKPVKKEKKAYLAFIAILLVVCLVYFIAASNYSVERNKFNIKSDKIPTSFDNFRIVQVSDLHNAEFDRYNKTILQSLFAAEPDIIVITGDMIDSRKTDVDVALHFASRAVQMAPTYYVNGNHESRVPEEYEKLRRGLIEAGVTVLENSSVDITIGNGAITLIGINDPTFPMKLVDDAMEQNVAHQLMNVIPDNDNYKVLLAHRPEYFDVYVGNVDLVFSGHAHGGQFIIPFVGGLVAPAQGFSPEYYEGLYTGENTDMIVSRGIGNSIIPFRINNKPEIVVAQLTKTAD